MSVRSWIGRDLRTTIVAVVAASVVAGPSAAAVAYVANADKVDNKHAVGAGAAVTTREGKLVATSPRTGLLPNDIIAKAPDSAALDGRRLTELLPIQVSAEFGDPDHEPITPLSGTQPDDVARISITVPAPGRVQVAGQTVLLGRFPSTSQAHAELSISTSPTTHNPSGAGLALWAVPGGGTDTSSPGPTYETVPTTRTFEVAEAGTYTYYVVARGGVDGVETGDGPDGLWHYTTQVQAQYFPVP